MSLQNISNQLVDIAKKKQTMIFSAESCTGGMLSQFITSTPGSSEIFSFSITTYSNEAKIHFLGVQPNTIAKYGAVSSEVAAEMAIGNLDVYKKTLSYKKKINNNKLVLSIAITGIAGPSGGSKNKPVGLIYCALLLTNLEEETICYPHIYKYNLSGNREEIREQTVYEVMKTSISLLQ